MIDTAFRNARLYMAVISLSATAAAASDNYGDCIDNEKMIIAVMMQ